MARLLRVSIPECAHHVTQRGNGRREVFYTATDRQVYLGLLKQYSDHYGLRILGYCLMTNHVHLVVVPSQAESMPRAMREVNGSYARYRNAIDRTSGHLWQNRYYSCVVEEERLGVVMRYVERNPVRAGMVRSAEDYAWSSAITHLGGPNPLGVISMEEWSARWSFEEWAQVIRTGDDQIEAIREATHTGRPLGSEAFTNGLEQRLARKLTRGTPGRPKNSTAVA